MGDPAPPRDALVTVLAANRMLDAHLARARLESEGIPVVIPDEQTASIDPLLVDALGGIRVQVRAEDAERAQRILAEPLPEDDEDDFEDGPRCPACDSTYVSTKGIFRRVLACERCEHRFRADDAPRGRPAPYRGAALVAPDEKPVFRLRRANTGFGVSVGLVLGLFLEVVLFPTGGWLGAVVLLTGYALGKQRTRDYCSEPSCRALLPPGARHCPTCRGRVHWVIDRAPAHYSAKKALLRGDAPPR